MTTQHFNLPDVGEGLTEAEIVTWHVAVGDIIEINDTVVEIETAKSLVELPSPFAGRVLELCVSVGEILPVGAPLMAVQTDTADPSDAPDTEQVLADSSSSQADSLPEQAPTAPTESAPAALATLTSPDTDGRLAAEAAVDSAGTSAVLVGSGTRVAAARRIRVRVPEEAAIRPHPAPGSQTNSERREPIRGVRKAVAAAMTRSAFTAPHATEWVTADVTATMELVRTLRDDRTWADVRVTPLLLVAKALLLAIRRFPTINASWDDEHQEIVIKDYVNLGIAVASERGLMVPNIKSAHTLDLRALALALGQLIDAARSGRTRPEDMNRGTVTITNIGAFGVDGATPILNPGESAILAVGQIRPAPWVVGQQIAIRQTATLSISFDHRLVDGELGSRVLAAVAEVLTNPAAALLL